MEDGNFTQSIKLLKTRKPLSKNAATHIVEVLKERSIVTMLAEITVDLVTDRLEIQPKLSIEERLDLCTDTCNFFDDNELTSN